MSKESEGIQLYFDTFGGELIVGADSYEAAIEGGAHPMDIRPLGELLTQKEWNIGPNDYQPILSSKWDRSLDVPAVTWVQNVVSRYQPGAVVTGDVLLRVGKLGILPRAEHFKRHPGGLAKIYEEAELSGVTNRGVFDAWTRADLLGYINRSAKELEKRPTWRDLEGRARDNASNPGPAVICRLLKCSYGEILELAGYPNIRSWDLEDYINWGVRFMIANNGEEPSTEPLNLLSAIYRGPHAKTIQNKFGTVTKFRELVRERFEVETKFQESVRKAKLQQIEHEIDRNEFPTVLVEHANTAEDVIAIRARYRILKCLLPDVEESYILEKAVIRQQHWFVRAIQHADPHITAGYIETTAVKLGLFEDIWPMDDYMSALKVA